MEKLSVWITGAGGLIGSYLLCQAPTSTGFCVTGLTRDQLDLTDFQAVRETFHRDDPCLVIHCAALSRSPACQAEPALARKLNVEVTRGLAELCADRQLVFLSTDLVFDGGGGHYVEGARTNPLSVYAETKLEAESVVLRNPLHLVIRTSLNGGVSPTGDRGFNEEMRRAWAAGRTLNLFTDEFRSPIGAAVTARAIWELAMQKACGVFHVAGAERLSRWDIGRLLASRYCDLNPQLKPGSLREYQGAPRAPDTSLDCSKAQSRLSFALPRFSRWLPEQPPGTF